MKWGHPLSKTSWSGLLSLIFPHHSFFSSQDLIFRFFLVNKEGLGESVLFVCFVDEGSKERKKVRDIGRGPPVE